MGLQVLDHTAARMAPLHERFYYATDLAALVAEACAPPPERVCRWTVNADGASGACGEDGWAASYLECFRCCPGCGGLIEEADGKGVTDE